MGKKVSTKLKISKLGKVEKLKMSKLEKWKTLKNEQVNLACCRRIIFGVSLDK